MTVFAFSRRTTAACAFLVVGSAVIWGGRAAQAQQNLPPPAPTASQPPTPMPPQTPVPQPMPVGALPQPIAVPPPPKVAPYLPFATLPALTLDETNNGVGLAQQMTRTRNLQGRVLWIDATANLDKVNTAPKIAALVAKIKSVGFNTIVFEIKPIIGYTLYPSRYAPKMTEWVRPYGTKTLPLAFDPLKEMVAECKAQGVGIIVSMNVFAEGHREFPGKGPGWEHPEWQTVLYEAQTRVRRDAVGTPSYPLMDKPNVQAGRSPDDLLLFTDLAKIRAEPNAVIAIVDGKGNVLAHVAGASLAALSVKLPDNGAALVGYSPQAAQFLRQNAPPGTRLDLDTAPVYVPISQRTDRQIPLMTNPNNPDVRNRMLDMCREVATNYPVDGFIFDDRLRFASLNADFSPLSRTAFETYANAGKPLKWPDDVFHYEIDFPSLEKREVPGPFYDAWLTFRALSLRNWLADAVRTIKTLRPQATVSTYVGSWYPDYPDVGANWGADDLSAGFRFLNDSYRKTGWAGLTDFVTTGCYYPTASISEAATKGLNIGESVEAAGQFSNRAVHDQTFVYAGIALDKFKNKPDDLKRVLQAAAATTQGVMCFDLSHDIEPLWPVFAEAFQKPAVAPHQVPGLVGELRAQSAARKAAGTPEPPVILYRGASGTGF